MNKEEQYPRGPHNTYPNIDRHFTLDEGHYFQITYLDVKGEYIPYYSNTHRTHLRADIKYEELRFEISLFRYINDILLK